MNLVIKKQGNVLESVGEEEAWEREKEFRDNYDDSEVENVSLTFKKGVLLKNIHDFDKIKPEMVEEIIFNLR